jgi:serine/threonine-protein kinase
MNTREEFGSYVLLKKLAEDPLGETFRAGKLGREGMEQVVLLRVFNGQALDAEKLWQRMADKRPVQEALKSPNIGNGADLGRVRNVPYVAYDYIAGKSLVSLIEQAQRGRSPIPTDHALLIAERIALGLAVGYETRVAEERVLHGFLVPHLVMLSNEGEIRVLGFEAAPGIRASVAAASADGVLVPYICPEALAGAPPSKADDVYSLGAFLFELLSGKRPPTTALAEAVDSARLANEGIALPPEIAGLIKRSLAPRAERIPDVVAWHKALAKLMVDGHFNPTTFNLAFFMHNLFRDEIERESKEIEAERTMVLPTKEVMGAKAPPADRHRAEEPSSPVEQTSTGVVLERYGLAGKEGGSKKGLFIGLAALLAVALGAGVYFGFLRPRAGQTGAPAAVATEPAPAADGAAAAVPGTEPPVSDGTAAAESAAPAGPSPEELRAQLDALLEEKTAAMEKNLRAQYDQKIQELQKAYETQKAAAERARQSGGGTATPPSGTATPPSGTATPPSGTASSEEAARVAAAEKPAGAPAPAAQQALPASAPASANPAPALPPATDPAASAPTTPPATDPASEAGKPKTEPAPPPAAAPKPRVRVGDLVEPGPGVTPPNLRFMPEPRYPRFAAQLNKRATVPVRVLVDENGRVERAEVEGPDPGYGFGEAAVAAAKSARFDAATLSGVRVKMWKILRIEFKP